MGLVRSTLLAASRSVWLRERATRYGFVRRAVSRFLPGETLEDALTAAAALRGRGMASVVTCLGENVASEAEVEGVTAHYLDVIDRVSQMGLDAEISVKLTHLGLDLGAPVTVRHLTRIVRRAAEAKTRVWIDMEDSSYTDATIDVYRKMPDRSAVGICLQAYLHRTPADLDMLMPQGPAIRLVKGAYREPPTTALPRKKDVDEMYFQLAGRLLAPEARRAGTWVVFGTHDPILIRRIQAHARALEIPSTGFEFDLLYGIRRDEQERLAREGHRVRVLISYGTFWFPWYMRRLAERPANIWFLARNLIGG
ncbi:MAG TPA: proline dehydrogenase family protein [Candidatus Polarisedimenticolia bacterium]|jgi:proline dehydrogenase